MDSLSHYERIARAAKEAAVRAGGPRAEIEPQVILFRGGRYFATAFVGAPSRAEWLLKMEAAVALSCADAVVHVTEGYMETLDSAERGWAELEHDDLMDRISDDYAHGDLAQRHTGGDTAVAEVLMVNVYRRGQPPAVVSSAFLCRGRAVEWGERLAPESTEGGIPDLMARAMAVSADRVARLGLLPWGEFAGAMAMAHVPVVVAPPAAYPRNAPCPCGSGRKHKVCCGAAS